MGNPVVHFEVLGKDAEALRTFYKSAFGWQFESPLKGVNVPQYAIARPHAGTGIDGGIGDSPDGYSGHVTFYIGVPNIEAAFDSVERLGGAKMMGPDIVPNGGPTIGLFRDPEGHVIGLVETN